MPSFTADTFLIMKDHRDRAGGAGVHICTWPEAPFSGYRMASILVSCLPVSILAAQFNLESLSGMTARADALWRITYAATAVVVQQKHWWSLSRRSKDVGVDVGGCG